MTVPASGRRVLVTGATQGIGRAVAQAFARLGDIVAVHYASRPEEARRTLESLDGEGHIMVNADISDPHQCRALVQKVLSELGGVDVLINNAGIAPSPFNAHPIADATFEDWTDRWEQMLSVNLLGAAHVTWAFAQQLREGGGSGAVVNIGSRGAFKGEPEHPAYAASKAALHAFGQSIAATLAPYGISVSSVAPGVVATERQATTLAGPDGDGLRAQSPFGRVATPEEVAHAVLYLASPEAVWSSGAVLDLNGASYFHP